MLEGHAGGHAGLAAPPGKERPYFVRASIAPFPLTVGAEVAVAALGGSPICPTVAFGLAAPFRRRSLGNMHGGREQVCRRSESAGTGWGARN